MSQKVTQKEAVYNAITSVLIENDVSFNETTNIAPLLSKEMRAQVSAILFEGFTTGLVELNQTYTDKSLMSYVYSLQSNWLRKDTRLNGGTKYITKNPGSRANIGDASLKAMKALLSTLTVEEDRNEVQTAIDARISELQANKVKVAAVSIDASLLPANLMKFIK